MRLQPQDPGRQGGAHTRPPDPTHPLAPTTTKGKSAPYPKTTKDQETEKHVQNYPDRNLTIPLSRVPTQDTTRTNGHQDHYRARAQYEDDAGRCKNRKANTTGARSGSVNGSLFIYGFVLTVITLLWMTCSFFAGPPDPLSSMGKNMGPPYKTDARTGFELPSSYAVARSGAGPLPSAPLRRCLIYNSGVYIIRCRERLFIFIPPISHNPLPCYPTPSRWRRDGNVVVILETSELPEIVPSLQRAPEAHDVMRGMTSTITTHLILSLYFFHFFPPNHCSLNLPAQHISPLTYLFGFLLIFPSLTLSLFFTGSFVGLPLLLPVACLVFVAISLRSKHPEICHTYTQTNPLHHTQKPETTILDKLESNLFGIRPWSGLVYMMTGVSYEGNTKEEPGNDLEISVTAPSTPSNPEVSVTAPSTPSNPEVSVTAPSTPNNPDTSPLKATRSQSSTPNSNRTPTIEISDLPPLQSPSTPGGKNTSLTIPVRTPTMRSKFVSRLRPRTTEESAATSISPTRDDRRRRDQKSKFISVNGWYAVDAKATTNIGLHRNHFPVYSFIEECSNLGCLGTETATDPIDLMANDVPKGLSIIAKNTSSVLGEVFDSATEFTTAQFCPIKPDTRPKYQPIEEKGKGENPTIAILCLGTDERAILIKKRRIIRKCALRAGDMLVVSGITQDVQWSFEKGKSSGDVTTCCFLFLGGSHSASNNVASGSESTQSEHTCSDYAESDTPLSDFVASRHDAIETPSLSAISLPLLCPTPTQIEPEKDDASAPHLPLQPEPEDPTPGELPLTPLETTIIQKTEGGILDVKSELTALKGEVRELKALILGLRPVNSLEKSLETLKKQMSNLPDATSVEPLEKKLEEMCLAMGSRIESLTVQADETQKYLDETKKDLCKYYESAFFQEDSGLIKEIHGKVSELETAYQNLAKTQPSPTWPALQAPNNRSGTRSRTTSSANHRRAPRRPAEPVKIKGKLPALPSKPTTLKSALITDSIMRQMPIDALGTGHSLHIINRRSWETLQHKTQETIDELISVQPHFIYVHLGVNDHYFTQDEEFASDETWVKATDFLQKVEQELPNTSIIVSLPLLTNHQNSNKRLIQFRVKMRKYCQDSNFCYENHKNFNLELLASDGLHPSSQGKELLTRNFRYKIHLLTKHLPPTSDVLADC